MAKARKQRTRIVLDSEGNRVSRGSTFKLGADGTETFRLLKLTKDGRAKVKPTSALTMSYDLLGLSEQEIGEGCDLHLMEEEAKLLLAMTHLLGNMRTATSQKRAGSLTALDSKHDLLYWLQRIRDALKDAGYGIIDPVTEATYWELTDLIDRYFDSRK